jgi:hypothetical protein
VQERLENKLFLGSENPNLKLGLSFTQRNVHVLQKCRLLFPFFLSFTVVSIEPVSATWKLWGQHRNSLGSTTLFRIKVSPHEKKKKKKRKKENWKKKKKKRRKNFRYLIFYFVHLLSSLLLHSVQSSAFFVVVDQRTEFGKWCVSSEVKEWYKERFWWRKAPSITSKYMYHILATQLFLCVHVFFHTFYVYDSFFA